MLPDSASSLSQGDLARLDAFLHSDACGRDAMGVARARFSHRDGVRPGGGGYGQWLRLVFGEPVFPTGDVAQEMLGLAVRLYRDIEQGLKETGRFHPLLRVRRRSGCDRLVPGVRVGHVPVP